MKPFKATYKDKQVLILKFVMDKEGVVAVFVQEDNILNWDYIESTTEDKKFSHCQIPWNQEGI